MLCFFVAVRALAILLLLGSFFAIAQNRMPAESTPQKIQILYIPGEAATFSWQREVGIGQASMTSCKNGNAAAEWFDLCSVLQSQSGDMVSFNFNQEPAPGALQTPPLVNLDSARGPIDVTFIQIEPVSFKNSFNLASAENLPDDFSQFIRITVIPTTQNARCTFDAPPAAKGLMVQKTWRLSTHERDQSDLLFEQEDLPFRLFHAFERITCQVILFDGLVFKKASFTQRSDSLGLNPGRNLNVMTRSKDEFASLDLAQWAGPLKSNEQYECVQNYPSGANFNLCDAFNLQTGHIKDTPREADLFARIFDSSLQILNLQIRKKDAHTVWPIIPVQLLLGRSAYDLSLQEKGIHLRFEGHGALQSLHCILDSSETGHTLKFVKWKLDGKPLNGWSQPWLPSFLLTFGHEYSCSDGNKESPAFKYDASRVVIFGPSRAFMSNRGIQPALLKLEPSTFLPPESTEWKCQTNTSVLGCELWGDKRNQARHLRLFVRKNETFPESAQVTVNISTGGATVTRVIQVLSENSNYAQSIDYSAEVEIAELNQGHLLCRLKNASNLISKPTSIRWYAEGRELAQFANRAEIPAPDVQKSEMVSCVLTVNSPNELPQIGVASREVQPSLPLFAELPEEILLDAGNAAQLDFLILSSVRNVKNIVCSLATQQGEILSTNLCRANQSGEVSPRGGPRKITRRVRFSMTRPQLQSIARHLVTRSSQDLFALEPLLLNISLVAQDYDSSRSVPVRLTLANNRPAIDAAVAYTEASGARICAFVASDPENNHISASMAFASDHQSKTHHTTLDPERLQKIFSSFFSEAKIQAPRFALFGTTRSQASNRLFGTLPSEEQMCEVLVSDGTLITTKKAREFSNPAEALQFLSMSIQRLHQLEQEKNDKKKSEKNADTLEESKKQALTLASTTLLGMSHRSIPKPGFSIVPLLARNAGKILVPLPALQKFGPLKIDSCKGTSEICRQLFISDESLFLANTTNIPSEHVFLALSGKNGESSFALLEFVNTIYVPHASALTAPCVQQLTDLGISSPNGPQEVFFSARFPGASELLMPASVVGRALALGASDIVCHSVVRSIDGRILSIKTSSLRESLPTTLFSVESPLSGPLSALLSTPLQSSSLPVPFAVHPQKPLNLGGLFATEQPAWRTFLPFMQNLQISKCLLTPSGSKIPEVCPAISDTLALFTPNSTFPLRLSAQLSAQFLGKTISTSTQSLLSPLQATASSVFLSVVLQPLQDQPHSYVCQVSGAQSGFATSSTPFRFRIFNGPHLVREVSQQSVRLEFSHIRKSQDTSLLCEVSHENSAEVGTFHETAAFENNRLVCLALTKGGEIEPLICPVSDASDLNSENLSSEKFGQTLQDSLSVNNLARYAALRAILTSENAPFKISRTWPIAASSETEQDAVADAVAGADHEKNQEKKSANFADSRNALPQSAFYLDEFRNRIVCLFGNADSLKGVPAQAPQDKSLRELNSGLNCSLLESINAPRSPQPFQQSDLVYVPRYPLPQGPNLDESNRRFLPEAEVIVGESAAKTFAINLLAANVKHFLEHDFTCTLQCNARAPDGLRICADYAKKMISALADTKCIFNPENAVFKTTAVSPSPQATLLVYGTASSQALKEYTANLVHFFSPTTEEQSP